MSGHLFHADPALVLELSSRAGLQQARATFLAYYRHRRPGENRRNFKRSRDRAFRQWLKNPQPLTGRTVS